MKKFLLFVFALAILGSAVAQKAGRQFASVSKHAAPVNKEIMDTKTTTPGIPANQYFQRESKGTTDLSKILLGSARNIYGGLLVYQNCLNYNKDLNTILFTHRGNDKGSLATYLTGNDVILEISADQGASFSQKAGLADGLLHRYPSSVFINDEGNSDTANTYIAIAGPRPNAAGWIANYYASEKYDLTEQNIQDFPDDGTFLELIRSSLTYTTDGKVHISGLSTVLNSAQTAYLQAKIFYMNGTWNTGTKQIDWESENSVEPNLVAAPSDNGLYLDGAFTKTAWSKDGSVGYMVMLGADNRPTNKPTTAPIIWKSTNGGTTWTLLDYFNWASLPAITDNIFPTKYDTTVYEPYFEEAGIVLDDNNKPHIFGIVRGGYSANLDSLSYIYIRSSTGTIMDGNVVELYMDESNAWQGIWVDSISADAVSAAKSPYISSPDNIGWDHRLSASTSEDRTKVFCTWTDSDWIFWGTEAYDFNPDLKGWGRDVASNMATDVINFTANTDLWGLAFFHYVSPNLITKADHYELPFVIADINTSGMQADEPVYYYYVNGIDFGLWTGIDQKDGKNASVATPCYPNPFTGSTRTDVTLHQSANVSISVSNIAGQVLSTKNYGTLTTGTHTLTIDGSNLSSGVYFYTVTVGDQKFNNKMIVK